MTNLYNHIKDLLSQNENYCKDGKFFKNVIVEAALQLNPDLLKLIITDDKAKAHFFQEVEGILIFDKVKFQKFVSNKQFLPDSFTAYKNKIGLTANGEYLTESKEVVLDFPYKDCVLEGGQTKEDQKRQEIFWNETLAPDEIDRLLDPKLLTNWKNYNKDGEGKVDKLSFKDNLILKGNNLLALSSIKKVYEGKVKLVYIDPPYNTGNDGFRYNDNFNHSSWLLFMKNRLQLAYDLLSLEGSIFVQLDYNESHYCKVLLDDIFGKDNFKNEIIWQRTTNTGSSKGMAQKLSSDTDSILYYTKSKSNTFNKQFKPYSQDYLKRFKHEDERGKYRWQYMATYSQEKLKDFQSKGMIRWPDKTKNPDYKQYLDDLKGIPLNNLWTDIYHINPMALENVDFKTQKPEELLARIIKIASNPMDIVLDFFMGSGTTCSVAHKLDRQFIGVEQMNYLNTVSIKRLQDTVHGKETAAIKGLEWNGGGSFVYAELAESNQTFINAIQDATTKDQLLEIWSTMKETGFLNYNIDPSTIDDSISVFKELNLDDQKRFLISTLDKNQLYINYSERNNKDYDIKKEDIKLSEQFYNLK